LLFFKGKGEISSSEYAKKYNVSDRTARRDLSELTEKNYLKMREIQVCQSIFLSKCPKIVRSVSEMSED